MPALLGTAKHVSSTVIQSTFVNLNCIAYQQFGHSSWVFGYLALSNRRLKKSEF